MRRACIARGTGFALLLVAAVSAPAHAQDHVDVLFYAQDGRVVTGATDFGPPFELLADVRVFPVKLDIATGGGVTLSPGFTASTDPPAGDPLPAETPIPFHAESVALLDDRFVSYWDATGDVAFVAPPNGERIEIAPTGCFGCSSVFIDADTAPTPTFALGTTTETGTLHVHHEFKLRIGVGSPVAPPEGVYLLALSAAVGGLAASDPFYLVFGERVANAELAAAADWVEANLLVPEPSTAACALVAWAALIALRARQRSAMPSSSVTSWCIDGPSVQ